LASKRLGNGALTTYEYDGGSQILQLINQAPDGAILSRFDYTYDELGRRTRMVTLEGANDYTYDAIGQLVAVTLPGGRTIDYTYDAEGNRLMVSDNGIATTYLPNYLNQYAMAGSATCQYDADGNLISKTDGARTWTYTYDNDNHLVQVVTPEGTWSYEYDAFGNRVATIENGQRTEYLIDPFGLGQVVGEFEGSGRAIAHYVLGLDVTCRLDAQNEAAFYQYDAMGNTSELTDSSGRMENQYRYLPFGERSSATEAVSNSYQYGGALQGSREGNGLDFMRARYYDDAMGRFTQRDPVGLAGGLNLYRYTANDPVNSSDPSGLMGSLWGSYDTLSSLVFQSGKGVDYLEALRPFLNQGAREAVYVEYLRGGEQAAIKLALRFNNEGAIEYAAKVLGMNTSLEAEAARQTALAAERALAERAALELAAEQAASAQARRALLGRVAGVGARGIAVIGLAYTTWQVSTWIGTKAGETETVSSFTQSWFSDFDYLTDGWLFGVPPVAQAGSHVVTSRDPNDITGPAGYGEQSYIKVDLTMYYLIQFENKTNASAPAQVVVVTNQLAAGLDYSTFELGNMGFGTNVVTVPPGRIFYSSRVDARGTVGLYVDVQGQFDATNGLAVWTFTSVDPVTGGEPEDPLAGFLPPNVHPPAGEGWVRYSVKPRTDSADGSAISAQASVYFDTNPRLDTPTITNAVDSFGPSSSVSPLAATSPPSFTVSWTGQDGRGAGIVGYDIFVATNQAPYGLWLQGTTNTSAAFIGTVGSTYAFYSIATDGVGHRELPPVVADALTVVAASVSTNAPSLRVGPLMNVARMGHYIANMPDGSAVVFGGHGQGFVSLNSIEIWQPATSSFTLVATPFTFDAGALVRLNDGRYLMAGGAANLGVAPGYNTAQLFDPAAGTVASTGTTMARARMSCRGAVLANGKALIVGGWYDTGSATYGELFDPATRSFAATGPLHTPRAQPVVLPTTDGKAVTAGGTGAYGSPSFIEPVELYDPAQNSFSVLANALFSGETGWALSPNGERAIQEQKTADGRYVLQASRVTNSVTEVVLAIFDPTARQFTKLAMNPAFKEPVSAWPPVVSAAENAVYFLSGYNTNSSANLVFRVQRVDLATGQRVASGELAVTNYYPGSSATVLLEDGRLFVTGGTTAIDSQFNFKPVKNTFFVEGLPAATGPRLSWSSVGRTLTLSWPSSATGYLLQSTSNLADAATWNSVTNSVTVVGDQNTVTVDLTGQGRFFRLKKPASSGAATGPRLIWSSVGRTLTLSWPSSATGYLMESSSSLAGAATWNSVTNSVTVVGDQNTVRVDLTGQGRLFRLKK
jgi:RHS repeat-associated protein